MGNKGNYMMTQQLLSGSDGQIPHDSMEVFIINYIWLKKKKFSLQGFWFLIKMCEDENDVIWKVLELFFKDINESDVTRVILCANYTHSVYKGTIGKAAICEGCKNNDKNREGFLCSNCIHCLCKTCIKIIGNMLTVLPNT